MWPSVFFRRAQLVRLKSNVEDVSSTFSRHRSQLERRVHMYVGQLGELSPPTVAVDCRFECSRNAPLLATEMSEMGSGVRVVRRRGRSGKR